jgi:predicted Fe-Mo cluster-binding NifX family protein
LCGDLGPRALNLCENLGIDVYVSPAETVKEIFEMWENNKLKKAGIEDVCEEHKL